MPSEATLSQEHGLGIAAVFWPFTLHLGGVGHGIALLWWAVLAVILVLYQRGKEKAKAQAAAEEEARRQQFLAEWDRRQAAEEERQRQALEQAKGTGHLFLEDGEVDAWCGVTPDGEQCHHRHRSPQAASECAAKHMSLAAWAVITLPSSS